MAITKQDNFNKSPLNFADVHNLDRFLDTVSREATGLIVMTYLGTGVNGLIIQTPRPFRKATIRRSAGTAGILVLESWREANFGSFVNGGWVTNGVLSFSHNSITLGANAACNANGITYLLEGVY